MRKAGDLPTISSSSGEHFLKFWLHVDTALILSIISVLNTRTCLLHHGHLKKVISAYQSGQEK